MRSLAVAVAVLAVARGALSFQCAQNLTPLCCNQVGTNQLLGGLLGAVVCGLNAAPGAVIAGGCVQVNEGATW